MTPGRTPLLICKLAEFWKFLCCFPTARESPLGCLSHSVIPREERVAVIETERIQRILPGALGKGRSGSFRIFRGDAKELKGQCTLCGNIDLKT